MLWVILLKQNFPVISWCTNFFGAVNGADEQMLAVSLETDERDNGKYSLQLPYLHRYRKKILNELISECRRTPLDYYASAIFNSCPFVLILPHCPTDNSLLSYYLSFRFSWSGLSWIDCPVHFIFFNILACPFVLS